MTEIDERLVAMHFDNKGFEKGAKDTIKTLEKLKESCDLDGAADSLNELGKAVEDLDLKDQSVNAEKLGTALSAIGKVAHKAFSLTTWPVSKVRSALSSLASDVRKWFGIDLARDIEQAATRMAKALTIEPVSAGFSKYEEETNSAASIYYAVKDKGKSLKDVYGILDKLTEYSDATSYSYTQMAGALANFVGSGQDINKSEVAIEGIANAAAKAGVSISDARIAFRNFSDAMSKGKFLMNDWQSIQQIKMDTEDFRRTVIQTAIELKKLDKNGMIKKGKKKEQVTVTNFASMLQTGFFDSEVMMKVLEKYADRTTDFGQEAFEAAQKARTFKDTIDSVKDALSTGWKTSFRLVFGDMEEATDLWTSLADRIIEGLGIITEYRNNLLTAWRGQGVNGDKGFIFSTHDGREDLIKTLDNIFGNDEVVGIISKFTGAFSKAWREVFGEFTYKDLWRITEGIKNFTDRIREGLGSLTDPSSRISKISKVLKGFFSIIKAGVKVLRTVGSIVVKTIMPFLDPILDFLSLIGELISNLVDGHLDFSGFISAFSKGFGSLGTSVVGFGSEIWSKIQSRLSNLFSRDTLAQSALGQWFLNIYDKIGTFKETIEKWQGWKVLGEFFTNNIINPIRDFVTSTDGNPSKLQIFFNSIASKITAFRGKVAGWRGWTVLGEFFTNNIITPIVNFVTSKDGDPSKLQVFFSNIASKITAFRGRVAGWRGWTVLGDFFTNHIINPIRDFVASTDGNPSKLQIFFNSIVSKITAFRGRVAGWQGWNAIGEFFTNNIRKPIIDLVTSKDGNPSKLQAFFSNIASKITAFRGKVAGWRGWTVLGDFFTNNIITPIINFITSKDGNPSKLQVFFSNIASKITAFRGRVAGWHGWKVLGDFFTNNIITPIVNFVTSKDGNPSQLKATVDSIVEKINAFKSSVAEWSGWDAIREFFNNHIKQPIIDLYNWLFGGGKDKKSAHTPIAVIASATVSDITSFGKQNTATESTLDEITSGLTEKLEGIVSIPDSVFSEKDGEEGPFQRVLTWFTDLGARIQEAWNSVSSTFLQVSSDISTGISDLRSAIDEVVNWLVTSPWDEWFNTFNDKLRTLGVTFGILNTGNFLGGAGKSLKGFGTFLEALSGKGLKINFSGVDDIGSGLKNLFTSTGEGIKSLFGRKDAGKQIGQILGNVKEGATTSTEYMKSFADVLIEFAGAVGLMVWAITGLIDKVKEINDLDPEKSAALWERLDQLFIIIGSSLGVTEIIAMATAFGGQAKVNSVGNALIGFAAAVEAMVLALGQLVGTVNSSSDAALNSSIQILDHFVLLIGAFRALSTMSGSNGMMSVSFGSGKSGSGLIGFAIAMEGLILELNQLIGIVKDSKPDDISTAMLTITELTGLVTAFSAFSHMDFGHGAAVFGGKSSGLIGFALAIVSMTHAVKEIAELTANKDIDFGVVQGTIAEIVGLIAGFKVLSGISIGSFSTSGKSGSGLIGFAIAIKSMVDALVRLGNIPESKAQSGISMLSEISLMIDKFVALKDLGQLLGSSFTVGNLDYKGGKGGTGILGFVIAMAGLLTEVAAIGALPADQTTNGLEIIKQVSGLIDAFMGLNALNSFMDQFSSTGQKVAGMVGLGLLMAGLAGMLWAIAELSKTVSADNVSAFSGILEAIQPNLETLSNFIATMSTISALSVGGSGWLVGAKAALAVVEFIGVLALAAYGVNKYAEAAPGVFENIENGFSIIAGAIGRIYGKAEGEREASKLNTFVEGLKTTSDLAGELSIENLNKLEKAFGVVKTINDNLPKDPTLWNQWFNGEMTLSTFGARMGDLGEGLARFNEGIGSGVDLNNVQAAMTALSLLISFARAYAENPIDYADISSMEWLLELGSFEDAFGRQINASGFISIVEKLGEAFNQSAKDDGRTFDTSAIIQSIITSLQSEDTKNQLVEALRTAFQNAISEMSGFEFIVPSLLLSGVSINSGESGFSGTPTVNSDQMSSLMEQWLTEKGIGFLEKMFSGDGSGTASAPTVTPVVTMSNTKQEADMLAMYLSNKYGKNGVLPSFANPSAIPEVRIRGLNNEQLMSELGSRIDRLNTNMANLKIYLDTGVLVGQTAAMYDAALGKRFTLASRR